MSSTLQSVLQSDLNSMGLAEYLPGENAFNYASRIKAQRSSRITTPSKRAPKPKKNAAELTAEVLRVNPGSNICAKSDEDKSCKIVGRRNAARSQ